MSKKKEEKEIVKDQVEDTATDTQVEEATETLSVEEQLQEELGKEKDKFLRLFAEFENYKKRTSKERIELFKTAGQDVMTSLLPVLDDLANKFEEALATKNIQDFGKELVVSDALVLVLGDMEFKKIGVHANCNTSHVVSLCCIQ